MRAFCILLFEETTGSGQGAQDKGNVGPGINIVHTTQWGGAGRVLLLLVSKSEILIK